MAVPMLLHASEICTFIVTNKRLEKVEIKSLGIVIFVGRVAQSV
jgi:hypothetical protein